MRIFLILCGIGMTMTWAQPQLKKQIPNAPNPSHSKTHTAWAILQSAFLPGWGESSLSYSTRSHVFLSTDLLLWASLYLSNESQERALQNAYEFAQKHAALNEQLSKSEALLQTMGEYRSRNGSVGDPSNADLGENYNLDQLRLDQAVDQYLPNTASYQWDWGTADHPASNENLAQFQGLLSDYRTRKITTQFILGGLILNRVMSVIDVVVLSRRNNGLELKSSVTPSQFQFNLQGEF